jgi:cell division protein FtsI/penicillin-binding protein 2
MMDRALGAALRRFTIHDYHAQNRVLSVPEVFTYSSNVGTAQDGARHGRRASQVVPAEDGQLDRLRTELPKAPSRSCPSAGAEINTVTIAFGHGLSVAPLQAVAAVNALMNGGYLIPPTFMKRAKAEAMKLAKVVIKPETSEKMRYLMRLNAEKGTASKANVAGYYVGGKTGTSEKVVGGRYFQDQAAQHLHGGHARGQAALSLSDYARRAPGPAGNLWFRDLRLERRADRRPGDRPHRADARHRAAVRPAAGGTAYFGQGPAVK